MRVRPALWGLVKFHIGGKVREPKGRMGEIPIPTVTVRMRKDKSYIFAYIVRTPSILEMIEAFCFFRTSMERKK